MNSNGKLENGFSEYPLGWVIGQNLFFMFYFGIGFVGMLPVKIYSFPLISFLYAAFLILMLLFVLRKHLCTNCYYYGKRCSTGWGILSSLMFNQRTGNYKLGIMLANITWGIATLLPVIIGAILVILDFTIREALILGMFIILTPISFLFHKNSCGRCRMRGICPASMIKEKSNNISFGKS
jgi:hypothetical protein